MTLPILLIEAHSRCNCRCEMCDIWKNTDSQSFTPAELSAQLDSIDRLGTRWVVFTGGEPLLNPDLFALAVPLRDRGIQVSILSTGLLFERFATQIAEHLDTAVVSIDGPPQLHDAIRHTPGGFERIVRGIGAIRTSRPGFPITARCVVQQRNHDSLTATASAAEAIGIDSISFLAADLTSHAFHRGEPWPILRQNQIALTTEQLPELDRQLAELSQNPFVADSPNHLLRIGHHFRAHLGMALPKSPHCNAPWISAFLRSDGSVQPCFFHPSFASAPRESLYTILHSPNAEAFRDALDIENNPTCQRCVCSLYAA
ncbi:MAG: radical SAM protein [Acidobacteriota bacterium]